MKLNIDTSLSNFICYLFVSLCSTFLCGDSMSMEAREIYDYNPNRMQYIDESRGSSEPPYNAILSLRCHFDGKIQRGTGFLISDKFALSSAHVVLKKGEGTCASDIICRVGRQGSYADRTMLVVRYIFPQQYGKICFPTLYNNAGIQLQEDAVIYDYVLLELASEIKDISPIHITPLYKQHPYYNDSSLRFCGYPGREYNKVDTNNERNHENGSYLYEVGAKCADRDIITINQASYAGMSGCPILYPSNSLDTVSTQWFAEAILSEGTEYKLSKNLRSHRVNDRTSHITRGCRLTQEKEQWISYYMKLMNENSKLLNKEMQDAILKITDQSLDIKMETTGESMINQAKKTISNILDFL